MTSANGYALEVDGYMLTAAWPAPFYALTRSEGPDGPDEPMLFHCETRKDAERKGGTLLDAHFREIAR